MSEAIERVLERGPEPTACRHPGALTAPQSRNPGAGLAHVQLELGIGMPRDDPPRRPALDFTGEMSSSPLLAPAIAAIVSVDRGR